MVEYTPGYIIGQCKRKWKDSKKITTYTDELSREEQAIFKEDTVLVGLFMDMKQAEEEIIKYIDKRLQEDRNGQLRDVGGSPLED